MPNKHYIKGRRKEYRICTQKRKEGYDIVQRSAGSHSPVDVWCVSKTKKEILLLQAKPKGYASHYYDKFGWLNGNFKVRFEII